MCVCVCVVGRRGGLEKQDAFCLLCACACMGCGCLPKLSHISHSRVTVLAALPLLLCTHLRSHSSHPRFTRLDALSEVHQVHKVETAGDCYIVSAGGLRGAGVSCCIGWATVLLSALLLCTRTLADTSN